MSLPGNYKNKKEIVNYFKKIILNTTTHFILIKNYFIIFTSTESEDINSDPFLP